MVVTDPLPCKVGKWDLSLYSHVAGWHTEGLLPGEGDVVSIGVPCHRIPVYLARNPDCATEFVKGRFSLDKEITVIHFIGEIDVVC